MASSASFAPTVPAERRLAQRLVEIASFVLLIPIVVPNTPQLIHNSDTQPWFIVSVLFMAAIAYGQADKSRLQIAILFGYWFALLLYAHALFDERASPAKIAGFLLFYFTFIFFPLRILVDRKLAIFAIFLAFSLIGILVEHVSIDLFHALFSNRTYEGRSLQFAYPEPSYAAKYMLVFATCYLLIERRLTYVSLTLIALSFATLSGTGILMAGLVLFAYAPLWGLIAASPVVVLAILFAENQDLFAEIMPARAYDVLMILQSNDVLVTTLLDQSVRARLHSVYIMIARYLSAPFLGVGLTDESGGGLLFPAAFGIAGIVFLGALIIRLMTGPFSWPAKRVAFVCLAFSMIADSIFYPAMAILVAIIFSGPALVAENAMRGTEVSLVSGGTDAAVSPRKREKW